MAKPEHILYCEYPLDRARQYADELENDDLITKIVLEENMDIKVITKTEIVIFRKKKKCLQHI